MSNLEQLQQLSKEQLIERVMLLEKQMNRTGRKNKMNEEQELAILEARKTGMSLRDVAKEFDCSAGLVHKIIKKYEAEGRMN